MSLSREDKIDKTYDMLLKLSTEIAKVVGQQENHKEILKTHEEKITVLDAYRNKTLGVVGIIGIFMGAIAGWVITHIHKLIN